MQTLEDILEEARRLPPDERRRLLEKLQQEEEERESEPSEQARFAALDKLLALSGTAHSDYTDVSSNKYKHLAEVYATKR